jgi:AcrR family transcriptional regulator
MSASGGARSKPTTPRIGRPPASVRGDQDLRADLLAAARRHFTAYGYASASVRAIAEECNVTPAASHYYFKSKAGLFAECHRSALQAATLRGERIVASDEPVMTKLRTLCFAHYQDAVDLFDIWAQLSQLAPVLEEFRDELAHWQRRYVRLFQEALEKGAADGLLRDDFDVRAASHHLIGALNHMPRWYRGDRAAVPQLIEELIDIYGRGILR